MDKIFIYLLKGLLHYINVLFSFLDFFDMAIMILIFVVLAICLIISSDFRHTIIPFFKSLKNVIKTIPGFLLLIIFVGYYVYILLFFENKINLILLLLTFYLIFKDYLDTNLNLLVDSKKSTLDSIKDVSFAIILIFLQQVSLMAEMNNYENLTCVCLSLSMIPIYSIIFIFTKTFCIYDEYYNKNKKRINIDDFDFFKLYIICLFRTKNFNSVYHHLDNILKHNNKKYLEYKNDLKEELVVNKENNNKPKLINKKIKLLTFGNILWIINMVIVIAMINGKRFLEFNYNSVYYICLITLFIFLWVDLMKIKRIKNQYDFIVYTFINITIIILILIYNNSLKIFRLSELGFLVPIFIFFRIKAIKEKIPFLPNLPFLTNDNFFKLDPKNYKSNQ